MTSKRLYIFDLDGTLLNTIADLAAACNHALQMTGHQPHPVADYPAMVGNGIYRLMARSLRAQGIEAEENGPEVAAMTPFFKAYYDAHNTDLTRPYPGMETLLQQLHEQGVMLAVASNKYQAATEQLVHHFFPAIPFVGILGQREGVAKKPDPQVVYELMLQAGVTRKEEVRYIGDSTVDIETAQRAGVDCCAVTWGFQSEAQLRAFAPEVRLAHTAPDLLQA